MNTTQFTTAILGMLIVGASIQYVFAANGDTAKTNKITPKTNVNLGELAKNPQFVKTMIAYMKKDHSFTQDIITAMLKDPMLRLQLIGHMTENKDAMKQMTEMIGHGAKANKMKNMDHSKMWIKKNSTD